MLKRCVAAEWLKLKHSHIWILMMVLPIISVLIGCGNFYMNQGVLRKEWYSLWSQVGLFYGEFFFPVLIAILCATISRLEHYNKNWNMVMTAPVPVSCVYLAKLVITAGMLLFVQGFFFVLYYLGGLLSGLSAPLPAEIPGWLLRGWLAGITISSLQLALSIKIRSFAVPVGIGLCCVFFGLGMYVLKMGMFFPHSLLTIGMGVLSQEGMGSIGREVLFLGINLSYLIIISTGAIHRMKTEDVIA